MAVTSAHLSRYVNGKELNFFSNITFRTGSPSRLNSLISCLHYSDFWGAFLFVPMLLFWDLGAKAVTYRGVGVAPEG